MKDCAEIMQQFLNVHISKLRTVRSFWVLTVWILTFWVDTLCSLSERSEEFKFGTLKITNQTKNSS